VLFITVDPWRDNVDQARNALSMVLIKRVLASDDRVVSREPDVHDSVIEFIAVSYR